MGYWITTKYGNHVYIDDVHANKFMTSQAVRKMGLKMGVDIQIPDKVIANQALDILTKAKKAGYPLPQYVTTKPSITIEHMSEGDRMNNPHFMGQKYRRSRRGYGGIYYSNVDAIWLNKNANRT